MDILVVDIGGTKIKISARSILVHSDTPGAVALAETIRGVVQAGFLVITPGVRLEAGAGKDDQKRVATPRAARAAGADAVVVGRPIRDAGDRRAAAAEFIRELG